MSINSKVHRWLPWGISEGAPPLYVAIEHFSHCRASHIWPVVVLVVLLPVIKPTQQLNISTRLEFGWNGRL